GYWRPVSDVSVMGKRDALSLTTIMFNDNKFVKCLPNDTNSAPVVTVNERRHRSRNMEDGNENVSNSPRKPLKPLKPCLSFITVTGFRSRACTEMITMAGDDDLI